MLLWMMVVCMLGMFLRPVTVSAEEQKTVRVGYYESAGFLEGASDGAVKTGYGYEYMQKIASYTGWKYVYVYGSYEELLEQMEEGEIDLMPGVTYRADLAEQMDYSDIAMGKDARGIYYFCTVKNRPDLKEELSYAQTRIDTYQPDYYQELNDKYGLTQKQHRSLTAAETKWLETHPVLRVGYMEDYLPYSGTDAEHEATGIMRDVMTQILQRLGVADQIEVRYTGYRDYQKMIEGLKSGQTDIIFPASGALWYAEQNGIMLSTSVISSTMNLVFTGNYDDDTVRTIAVNENNMMQYYYAITVYPDAQIISCSSIDQCLQAVADGVAGSTILNALRTNMLLRNSDYKEMLTRQLPRSDDRCFAVLAGNSVLLGMVNYGLGLLDHDYALNASYKYADAVYKYSVTDWIAGHISLAIAFAVLLFALVVAVFVYRSKNLKLQAIEAKRHKQELTDALEVAQHANKAKTNFLNNMSHDIRTPMNAIIGFTSLAVTHIDNKEQVRDYLGKIMTSSNHLLSLINDMLDMSRIESGQVKIEENECHLPTIMHDLRNILQSDVRAKRLDFFIDTVDVVDENIICDKLRLNQVLLNCMSNAIKFTRPGGTVGIRIIQKPGAPDGQAYFDFVVKDNGIGMSPEFAEHMFEPFTREENTTVSGIPGTGLGMSITKYIIDMMGGTISVKSEKGVGTEITASLAFRLGSNPQRVKVIRDLVGLRALVADDSMDTCVSVSRMLESIGMSAEWTMSGVEATYKAKFAYEDGKPYKAFIIDWLMPDMNGVEVVRRIRAEIGNETPIIILTAYDWSDIEEEARAAGVTAFCAKPIFLSDLYEILSGEVESEDAKTGESEEVVFTDKRVLLVEDNELNTEIAQEILEQTGVEVEVAENGQIAVDKVQMSEPGYYDMIFMDIQMPVMDGYEATRWIRRMDRADAATLPIVAMTANAFEEDRQTAYESGMNEHTSKPIEVTALYEIMKRYLS